MKTSKTVTFAYIVFCTVCLLPGKTLSQGTFQNLDFESANIPSVPSGQFGGLVATTDAIPNWFAYYGTTQTTQILENNFTLGAVNISILGPDWSGSPILQGSYSVLLQSGLSVSDTPASAAIAQTGTIPADSLSVQFLAYFTLGSPSAQLGISVGGQSIPLIPLSITPNYTLYGADISAYSGQTKELRISSLPSAGPQYGSFLIDSIEFSNQPIPEPSTFFLFGLGTLILGWRFLCKRK